MHTLLVEVSAAADTELNVNILSLFETLGFFTLGLGLYVTYSDHPLIIFPYSIVSSIYASSKSYVCFSTFNKSSS